MVEVSLTLHLQVIKDLDECSHTQGVMYVPFILRVLLYSCPLVTMSARLHSISPMKSCLLVSSTRALLSTSYTINRSIWISSKRYSNKNVFANWDWEARWINSELLSPVLVICSRGKGSTDFSTLSLLQQNHYTTILFSVAGQWWWTQDTRHSFSYPKENLACKTFLRPVVSWARLDRSQTVQVYWLSLLQLIMLQDTNTEGVLTHTLCVWRSRAQMLNQTNLGI